MTQSTDIANRALTLLGADRITSLDPPDENSTAAAIMDTLYQPAKMSLIREYQWNCAKQQIEMAQLADAPLFGFQNAYQIPPEVLRVLFVDRTETQATGVDSPVYSSNTRATFKVVGDQVHTNVPFCRAMCLVDIDEPKMDSLLQDALVYRLAAQAAYPITRSNTAVESFNTLFQGVIAEARVNAIIEGSADKTVVDGLTGARISGWRGIRYGV